MKKMNNQRPDRGLNKKQGNTPKLTAEEERRKLAKELRLRPKSVAVIDELLNDPKLSQTEAYLKHHNTSRKVASVEASKLLAKPSAQIYSRRVVGRAKRRVAELVETSNESIALKASQDILDRTEGKAIQRSENTSRSIEVKLDLSGKRIGGHYVNVPQALPES